ncbi:MAG: class I SAM-dependent methyltransferase [Sulfuricaulis sp.]
MRHDIERWNRKYRAGNPNPDFVPDPLLTSHAHLLDGKGAALDLACGVGHNAMFLARRGYVVTAIDGSETGLGYCRAAIRNTPLRIHLVAADLERISLPRDNFDVVLVVRYLYRPLVAQIKTALKPGGLVICKTFNTNHLRERPEFKKQYLLERGELPAWFSGYDLIATNDSPRIEDTCSYLIGRKPAAST